VTARHLPQRTGRYPRKIAAAPCRAFYEEVACQSCNCAVEGRIAALVHRRAFVLHPFVNRFPIETIVTADKEERDLATLDQTVQC
jgi:hypothetical protein